MCKEMPVIPVDRVMDKKRIIGKMEGQGGQEARWVADPKKTLSSLVTLNLHTPVEEKKEN
jgi:hypothetical protein